MHVRGATIPGALYSRELTKDHLLLQQRYPTDEDRAHLADYGKFLS